MTETQRRFLRKLRDALSKGVQGSSIPRTCSDLVESLRTCGAVEFRPADSGRGVSLAIVDDLAFSRFVSARCPQGLDIDVDSIPDRATAIRMLGDAKAVRRASGQGIIVRSTKPNVVIRSTDGEAMVHVSQLTLQAGGAAIQLSTAKTWTFAGHVALVENADAFWKHEAVLPEVDLAIFASGCMSRRLLSWLASPEMSSCQITLWGDYDPVGVREYLRLTRSCPDRVRVHAPTEVDELLRKIGKRRLVVRQAKCLDRIRSYGADPYVRRMIDLFDRHRRGLEQEIFLLSPSDRIVDKSQL